MIIASSGIRLAFLIPSIFLAAVVFLALNYALNAGLALVDKLMRDMGGVIEQDRYDGWTRFRLHLALAGGRD